MINILLSGACGRMGHAVADFVHGRDDCKILCGVDVAGAQLPGFPVYGSFEAVPADARPDVIIDFSNSAALGGLAAFAAARGIPAVLATTGYNDADLETIKALSGKTAVFRSANMSIGICLLKKLARESALFLGEDFDIEILEKHHNRKLDAPSGTALALADAINSGREDGEKFEYVYERQSRRQPRSRKEIGISAIRGGNIVGEHDVIFAGENEVITLSHSAMSRSVFAQGAVKAALYIAGRPAGMYDMDMLAEDILR